MHRKGDSKINKRNVILGAVIVVGLSVLAVGLFVVAPAAAKGPAQVSTSDVYHWWDQGTSVGSSKLVRNNKGISADYTGSGLPAGQAATLWFIVFNNPGACTDGECGLDDLGASRAAQGDFLFASGHVIDADGTATFGGSLKAGDTSGSGLHEIGGCVPGLPNCGGPIGLVNTDGALVVLAVHSHGPKLSGQALKEQISSYTGGCDEFIGVDGFATAPEFVPSEVGQCSTIQLSPHAPNGG